MQKQDHSSKKILLTIGFVVVVISSVIASPPWTESRPDSYTICQTAQLIQQGATSQEELILACDRYCEAVSLRHHHAALLLAKCLDLVEDIDPRRKAIMQHVLYNFALQQNDLYLEAYSLRVNLGLSPNDLNLARELKVEDIFQVNQSSSILECIALINPEPFKLPEQMAE